MVAIIDRRAAFLGLGVFAMGAASLAEAQSAPSYEDPDDMYAALRTQPGEPIEIGGGRIKLVFADGAPGVDRARVGAWVRGAAAAVTAYYGHYPVKEHGLLVIAQPGRRLGSATTFGYGGPATRIHVGIDAMAADFARDWVMVHEMVHTALPNVPRRALWLQEGNATYVEPIARAMIGGLEVPEVWREAALGMQKGAPMPDEGGMDGTSRWGRLYWGGATFWLLAEIAIYRQSRGAHSLRDALRRINQTSGGNGVEWTPEQVMEVGDMATRTHALSRLYTQFATMRIDTDLAKLFEQLGVAAMGDQIALNDRAPLAALRLRVTRA